MRAHFKSFAQSSALYTFAVGIEALVPFALLPILTHMLNPTDYGIWVLFVALYSFIRPLVTLNLQDAVRSRFQQLAEQEIYGLIVGSLVISTIATAVVETVLFLFRDKISTLIQFPDQWLWAAPMTAYVYGIFYLFLAVFQFRGEVGSFIRLQLLQAGLGLLFVVAFLTYGLDWRGAILGRMLGVIVTVFLAWPYIAGSFRFSLSLNIGWRTLFSFGLKYLPAGIGVVIIPLANRLFVAHYSGVEQAGFLGIASLFGSALSLITTGFLFAWQPKLFRAMQGDATNHERSEVRSFLILFSLLFPLLGVAVIAAAKIALPLLVPAQYLAAIPLIALSIWSCVAQAYFDQSQTVLLGARLEAKMSLVYLLVISLNALLALRWVRSDGSSGVLAATCVSFLVGTAVSALFAFGPARRALKAR